MKKIIILPLIFMMLAVSFSSCSKFVEDVNPLIDQVEDTALNDPSQALFLLRGLKGTLYNFWQPERPGTEIHGDTGIWDSRTSDSVFTESWNQTTGSFNPRAYNGKFERPHVMRFQAQEVLRRLPLMLANGSVDAQLQEDMQWWANFLLGYSHHVMATWHGLDAAGTKAGNVISPDPTTGDEFGSFLSYKDVLDMAIKFYKAALQYSPSATDGIADAAHAGKVVNSFMARAHLDNHAGGYGGANGGHNSADAKAAAAMGLQMGDPPFVLTLGEGFTNRMWDDMGRGTSGGTSISARFARYILADRKEGEIVNQLRSSDTPAATAFYTAANVFDHPGAVGMNHPDFPVFDLTQGFSLSYFPGSGTGNVFGDPVVGKFEGESAVTRGHFNAADPREGEAERLGLTGDQTARIQLIERTIGEAQLKQYKDTGGWIYAPTIQKHPNDLPTVFSQDRYNQREQDLVLIDWQEMNLIQAEVAITLDHLQAAADFINENRVDGHGLDPIDVAHMEAYNRPWGGAYHIEGPIGFLIEERDKELMLRSTRLYDQFRFGIFHLPLGSDWVYFPIGQREIDANPNISETDL